MPIAGGVTNVPLCALRPEGSPGVQTALAAGPDQAGTLGRTLHQLFQRSFSVAKEVRTSTEIGAHSISMAAATVRLAAQLFEDLSEKELEVLRERGPAEEEDEDIGPNTTVSSDGDDDEAVLMDMEEADAAPAAPASIAIAPGPRLVRGAT